MDSPESLLSRHIEQLLENKNLTANRLAQIAGISQSSLSAIISTRSANPGVNTLAKVASGLGMSLIEFLDFPPYNQRPDGSSAAKQRSKWEELGNALTPEERERVRRILLNGKE